MDRTPLRQDLLNEMQSLRARIEEERLRLIAADNLYDERGVRLQTLVISVLEPYWDRANKREVEIQDAARDAAEAVRGFTGRRANILNAVGFLLGRLNQVAIGQALDAMTWPPDQVTPDRPLATVHHFVDKLSEVQRRIILSVARTILAERMVLDALPAIPGLITIRQARLEAYVGETVTVDVDAALKSISNVVNGQVRTQVIETLLEAVAKSLNIAAETAFPIVKFATILADLYVDLSSIESVYARENADDVFRFRRQIEAENEAIDAAVTLLNSLFDSLQVT